MSCLRSAFLSLWNIWLISLGIVAFCVWLCEKLPGASVFVIAAVWAEKCRCLHLSSSLPEICQVRLSSLRYIPFFPTLFKLSFPQIYKSMYSLTQTICFHILVPILLLQWSAVCFWHLPSIWGNCYFRRCTFQEYRRAYMYDRTICKPIVFCTYDKLLHIICVEFLSHAKLM